MVSEPGDDRARKESPGFDQPVRGKSVAPGKQFLNDQCIYCKHPFGMHFTHEDQYEKWTFCMLATCECFLDEERENAPS